MPNFMVMNSGQKIEVYEIPGACWPSAFYPDLKIDRSETRVFDYLQDIGLRWVREPSHQSLWLRKAELSQDHISSAQAEINLKTLVQDKPNLLLIGEPLCLAPQAYSMAQSSSTLAVAPQETFDRMYFCAEWADPEIENWKKRQDRICWVGRPLPDRIQLAKLLIDRGYPLDIYSRQAWPVSAWRGPAEDDVLVAKNYRYRIVFENSRKALYHSEKLFTSIRSGCVTFYVADPSLRIPEVEGCYLELTEKSLLEREQLSASVLEKMNQFMFSSNWEIYSPKAFYDRIRTKADHIFSNQSFQIAQIKETKPTNHPGGEL